jgi:secondary thiamine-phosphate synthase enzyme
MVKITVPTSVHAEMIDITAPVQEALAQSGVKSGLCVVFVPHTTAGITINENADPDVQRDILAQMEKIAPQKGDYRHNEGNSAGHVKTSLFGSSVTIPVEDGRLCLGTWQAIYFCEFDGPRQRQAWIQIR